jgi:hypothetical protein
MFRCDVCGSVAPPRTACNRVILEIRLAEYAARPRAYWQSPRAGGKGKWIGDPGGRGTEIVREVRACDECAAKAAALERRRAPPPSRDQGEPPSKKAASARSGVVEPVTGPEVPDASRPASIAGVPSQRASRLSEANRELIARALDAAVVGPYFPVWELHTLMGFSWEELARIADAWPETVAFAEDPHEPAEIQRIAVNNVLAHFIGYPHRQWDRLTQELGGADSDRLIELLFAWRGGPVAGYFEALE